MCIPRVPFPRGRIQLLLLLNFTWLQIAQLSNLPRSLGKAFPLWTQESTAPPRLFSADVLQAPSSPTSKSFLKTSKRTGPKAELWGTPLVTACQPAVSPSTPSLWARPSLALSPQSSCCGQLTLALEAGCCLLALQAMAQLSGAPGSAGMAPVSCQGPGASLRRAFQTS